MGTDRIFGDDAEADIEEYFAAPAPWHPRRVMMIGRRAADALTAAGWDIVLLDDTRAEARKGDVRIRVVPHRSGILAERSGPGGMSEGGHTIDVGAIEDAVIAWSRGASAAAPDDCSDWIAARST